MRNAVALILLLLVGTIRGIHYLAGWLGWYDTTWWLDIVLHLMGGAFIGVLFFYLFRVRHDVFPGLHPALFIMFGAGFVALVGIAWELYEFWADVWLLHKYAANAFPGWVHGDTLLDLVNDLIGGAVAIAALHAFFRHKK